jgi:hypothetical protein
VGVTGRVPFRRAPHARINTQSRAPVELDDLRGALEDRSLGSVARPTAWPGSAPPFDRIGERAYTRRILSESAGRIQPRRVARLALAIACFLAIPSAQAAGSERVVDGGFDASICSTTDCTSSAWSEEANAGADGPICNGSIAACALGGSGYSTAPNWARLGFNDSGGLPITSVDQPVAIPAAPATLEFALHIEQGNGTGFIEVEIDGTVVFLAPDSTAGFTNYALVTRDVSAFAGPGTHTLSFEGQSATGAAAATDSFDVDDVSLDAPDPAPPPPPPPPPGGGPGVGGATPPNAFTTGAPNGLKLPVTVPGAGLIAVSDAKDTATQALAEQTLGETAEAPAKEKTLALKPSSATATGAGTVDVKLKLAGKAKKKYRQGKTAKVEAAVSFTPTGGSANITTLKLKLKK